MSQGQGITITINADTEQAVQKVDQFFKGAISALEKMSGMGAAMEELGAAVAGVFSIVKLFDFTKEVIDAAEAMGELNKTTGLSVKFLSALREEANKTAVGFQGASAGLEFFARNLGAAIQQGGAALRGFRETIGIDNIRKFAAGLTTTDEVLKQVVESMNKMPDGPERANLAAQIFGRQWREILPVITEVQGELDKGLITEDMVKQATEFNRLVRTLKEDFEAIFIRIAQNILPALEEMAARIKDLTNTTGLRDNLVLLFEGIALEFARALTKGVLDASAFFAEAYIRACYAIGGALNKILVNGLNKVIDFWNASSKLGGVFGTINYAKPIDTAAESKHLIDDIREGTERLKPLVDNLFDKPLARLKAMAEQSAKMPENFRAVAEFALNAPGMVLKMFGFGAGTDIKLSIEAQRLIDAVDKAWLESTQGKKKLLDAEEKDLKDKIDKEVLDVKVAAAEKTKIEEIYAAKRRELARKEEDEKKAIQLSAIQGARTLLEKDPFLTSMDKRERLLALLKKENDLLLENIAIKQRQILDANASDESKLLAQKQLQEFEIKQAETQQSIATTSAQGTLGGEFRRVLTDMGNQWDSWAHQIANTFQNVIGGAIDVISKGITGLIMGTKTWSQALREIGTSILDMIINAIVKMFITWIVNMTVLRLLQKLFGVESNTQAAQSAAAWTPAATAASIASYGAAATVGTAAVVAGMAVSEAFATGLAAGGGAYAEGGRPPMGMVSLVGERGPELFVPDQPGTVVPADVSAAILRGVGGGAGSTTTTAAGGGGGTQIHLGLLSDRSQVPAWVNSAQGEAHLVDLVKRNIHLIQKG